MSLLSIHHFLYTYTFLHVYYLAGDESEGEGEFPTDIYNRDGATSRESLGCSLAPEPNSVVSLRSAGNTPARNFARIRILFLGPEGTELTRIRLRASLLTRRRAG